jgi:hypothetical protein
MTIAVVDRINNKKDPEMSTYKNTSGDLTLTGDNGFATLTINYANTVFNGSLECRFLGFELYDGSKKAVKNQPN